MSTYSEMLKHPKWQKKRLEILNRDKWCCVKCKDTETTLQVHHLKYTGKPWEAPKKDLVTLCADCHLFFTKENIPFNSVLSITKLNRVFIEIPTKGFIVDTEQQTMYYHLDENSFSFISGFRRNSRVLETLYKINHG